MMILSLNFSSIKNLGAAKNIGIYLFSSYHILLNNGF